jgi:uncharacterized surface protein with fasciclin (FAS1) repeats
MGLERNFSMLITPRAELTLLAPTEAAFFQHGFNESNLPAANVSAILAKTWILDRPVSLNSTGPLSINSTRPGNVTAMSLLGDTVTFTTTANGTLVGVNGTMGTITTADIPACASWVHVVDAVLPLEVPPT